ncbi:MAG: universal stress protein [Burkholderiaceae bacterium]|nr:universal stress protein [Burkholderiaceae bacterium]
MASLWRVARDDGGEPALMKVPAVQDDPAAIVGFEVEQMIMPLLSGIHVPRFIAAGGFEAQPYIVMEYVPGPSLRGRLEDAPLPSEQIATIGASIAEALHDLHLQHVIHLDVKPSNVLFRPGGEAVLIDYGLARHESLPDLLAEEFRLPLGTGPYISPEQVLGVRDDPRSDLFALGAILYHLATGQRAFGSPSSVAGLRKRLYRAPVPPRQHNPQCPPWLQEIVLHCLEVDPELRYGSAAQAAFELAHPDMVALTARAHRRADNSLGQQLRRWFRSVRPAPLPLPLSVARQLRRAPIVLAAVDVSEEWEALADALRNASDRVLQAEPHARLACVSVLKTARIGLDDLNDEAGNNRHIQRLVQLQHWARPLALPAQRLTCHVLEAPDPAAAIVEFARSNRVDHIVIGSRGSSALRRYLGSVSTQVVAEAPCSVTVVKVPQPDAAGELASVQ